MIDCISMETCYDILKQLLLFLRNFSYRKRVYELLIEQQKNKNVILVQFSLDFSLSLNFFIRARNLGYAAENYKKFVVD